MALSRRSGKSEWMSQRRAKIMMNDTSTASTPLWWRLIGRLFLRGAPKFPALGIRPGLGFLGCVIGLAVAVAVFATASTWFTANGYSQELSIGVPLVVLSVAILAVQIIAFYGPFGSSFGRKMVSLGFVPSTALFFDPKSVRDIDLKSTEQELARIEWAMDHFIESGFEKHFTTRLGGLSFLIIEALEHRFASLSEVDRSVLLLWSKFNLSDEQIARSLRVNPFDAWAQVVKAEANLKAELEIEIAKQLLLSTEALLTEEKEWWTGVLQRIRHILSRDSAVRFLLRLMYAVERQSDRYPVKP